MKRWIHSFGLLSIAGMLGGCTTRQDYFSRFPANAFEVQVIEKDGGHWLRVNAIPIVSNVYYTDYLVEYPGSDLVVVTMKGRNSLWGKPSSLNPHIEAGGESFMRVWVPLPVDKFPAAHLSVVSVRTENGSLIVRLQNN